MFRFAILVLSLVSSLSYAELLVTQATVRLLPPGVPNTSAYFTIENRSKVDVVLIGAQADFVNKAEMHNHISHNGMMKMQQQSEVTIAAGRTLRFDSGGLHIMLFGLKKSLKEHELLPLTLTTKSGKTISFKAMVQKPMAHKHHH